MSFFTTEDTENDQSTCTVDLRVDLKHENGP